MIDGAFLQAPLSPILPPFEAFDPIIAEPIAPKKAPEKIECQCVKFLRIRLGLAVQGNADTLKPNIPFSQATVGDIILLKYGRTSHAVLLEGFTSTGNYLTHGSNYPIECKESFIELDPSSKKIIGFLRPLQKPAPSSYASMLVSQ